MLKSNVILFIKQVEFSAEALPNSWNHLDLFEFYGIFESNSKQAYRMKKLGRGMQRTDIYQSIVMLVMLDRFPVKDIPSDIGF
ncbi:unnamed protein product [Caenorhabditis bovis]|uniref:Uncharacterized protein n=1 Tax=Caenorhabditis bovis TaxID=2654633 RepID=A0A8S1F147_9PELO|nr:unnamed protein product [Caenorhabditis bovis]CAB3405695.1 unnamed protein product [Caenorhabditis bovis]